MRLRLSENLQPPNAGTSGWRSLERRLSTHSDGGPEGRAGAGSESVPHQCVGRREREERSATPRKALPFLNVLLLFCFLQPCHVQGSREEEEEGKEWRAQSRHRPSLPETPVHFGLFPQSLPQKAQAVRLLCLKSVNNVLNGLLFI